MKARRRLTRAAAALMLTGGLLGVPSAAVAGPTGPAATTCSRSWHYITHGQSGKNVRPDPLMYQGNTTLYADATPGADYWNQQFLFCRDPGWTPGHYAIYSNLTKQYWSLTYSDYLAASSPTITGVYELFHVWKYDSTWWVIRAVGFAFYPKYAHPDETSAGADALRADPGPLNGTMLFRITSPDLMG